MAEFNSLSQLQIERNANGAASWELFTAHRQRVTQLLLEKKHETAPSLCVLGAGNCNDLDLKRLTTEYSRVDLVDIDSAALQRAVESQAVQAQDALRLHGEYDLTGVWDELASLRNAKGEKHDSADVDKLIAKAQAWTGLPKLGTYGTVASVCLLSQLVDGVIKCLGESHPRLLEVIAAIRQRHIQLLCELTTPGGYAVLVTDFVSSDTAPALPHLTHAQLSAELMRMIKEHNFFTGLNPFRLQMLLRDDATLASQIDSVHCQEPWLWNFGPRHYAVTAISFRRR